MANSTNKFDAINRSSFHNRKNVNKVIDLEEKCEIILSIIGERKVQALYHHFRSEKISFAAINKYLKNKEIKDQIGNVPVMSLSKNYRVSRMTVYRLLHEKLENNNNNTFK